MKFHDLATVGLHDIRLLADLAATDPASSFVVVICLGQESLKGSEGQGEGGSTDVATKGNADEERDRGHKGSVFLWRRFPRPTSPHLPATDTYTGAALSSSPMYPLSHPADPPLSPLSPLSPPLHRCLLPSCGLSGLDASSGVRLFRCSACRTAHYCSPRCGV